MIKYKELSEINKINRNQQSKSYDVITYNYVKLFLSGHLTRYIAALEEHSGNEYPEGGIL